MTVWITPRVTVVVKHSTKPIVHHLHCSVKCHLRQTVCPYRFIVYLDCCVLWSVHVCGSCQTPSPCLVSVLQTGEGKGMSACQYPAASLLLVFGAHRAILSVCCTCQGGMWEMREGERRSGGVRAPSLMLSGPKNRQHPPFFSIPSASLFPYSSLPVSPSLFSLSSSFPFLLVSLFGLSKHALWCPMIRLLKCNARQFGHC